MERHHLGVTRNALRENRLVIFGLCSIGLRRHGPFISCHIFLPLCFALSGTHLGSSILHVYSRYDILYIAFVSTDRCTDLNPGIVAFEFQIPGPPPLVCSLDITTAYLVIVFRIQPVRQI